MCPLIVSSEAQPDKWDGCMRKTPRGKAGGRRAFSTDGGILRLEGLVGLVGQVGQRVQDGYCLQRPWKHLCRKYTKPHHKDRSGR